MYIYMAFLLRRNGSPVQGTDDSVRLCFIKFALSFLVVGDSEVIKNILELKGESAM